MLGGTFDESAGRSESEIRPRVRLHPTTLEEKKMRLERDRSSQYPAPLQSDVSGEKRHGDRCSQHEPESARQPTYLMRTEKRPHQAQVDAPSVGGARSVGGVERRRRVLSLSPKGEGGGKRGGKRSIRRIMSGRWNDAGGGGDSSQDFTQATQEESVLEMDEYTQVEPVADGGGEDSDLAIAAEPVPWGRLMRLSGGSAVSLMPRPEQTRGRALNEVTLGRGKVCEVQVSDQRVSSKHCRIYCEVVSGHLGGMEVYVEDMSANGTWINQDMKLVRGQRRLLHSGDEISLLNPYKYHKRTAAGGGSDKEAERGGGAEANAAEKLEAEAATFTFINLNRNRGGSHGRAGSLSVAETLRARTAPGVSSPVLRSSASGVAGIFGGARKVEDLYDVREMIGHGTSGEVRRAINRKTGKQVAVKVIETRKFALTPGLTPKELVQEAEMLKRVDHEYIIKLEDIFQTEQAVYLVMDLVSGGDLFDRIVEKGVYAEDLAQELLFRVLTAVNYLHSQDIVHRDLKPENILLVGRDNDVDVKITDFGLAKRANKEGLKTFCGTPQYFAPEVLKRRNTVLGVGRYGKEADMWSVGVILYILLSGTHPFHTTTLFDQITHASYSMNGEEWELISAAAKDLVSKLLTESPKARLTAGQALAHPFITDRAAARASLASGAAGAAGAAGATGIANPPPGAGTTREDPSTATAKANADVSGKQDRSAANGERPDSAQRAAVAEPGGRTFSHETEPASNSGAEETSVKSLSPTEGGGGSAKAAPAGATSSPKDERPPPRGVVSDLPPPQPREPAKVGGGGGGGAAGGRSRKRPKKDSAGEKPPAPYSQLQMQVVRVCGAEQGGGSAASQGAASGSGGATTRAAVCSNNSGVRAAGPALPAPGVSGKGRGAAAHAKTAAAARPRNAAHSNGRGPGSRLSQETTHTVVANGSSGRGSRKAGGGAHAPQCVAGAAAGAVGVTPPARHSVGKGAAAAASTVRTASPADDDDIMDYSSDDSPAKGKRSRAGRGRQVASGNSKVLEPARRGRASGSTTAATTAPPTAAAVAAAAVAPVAAPTNPSSVSSTAVGDRKGGATGANAGGGAPHREATGSRQMHLEVGHAGKLNLRRPLSRAGVGSASGSGQRVTGDQAVPAAAGGAAAPLDESLGGGAHGGAPGNSEAVGKGGRKGKGGGGKPQRTMTHLWKRAESGQA
eukprot:jgi/Undpi1/5921/HiC_scaffold_2.g01195.m1